MSQPLSRAARALCLCLLTALVTLLPAAGASGAPPANPCAPAPATVPFYLNTTRPGIIDLHFYRAQGVPVSFYECVGDEAYHLGDVSSPVNTTSFWAATFWDCTRLTRRFVATATLPDGSLARGTAGARTKSCADRFKLELPRRRTPGQQARVRVVDRWGIGGIRTSLCITSPRDRRVCRSIVFARPAGVATRHFRPETRGQWRVMLRVSSRIRVRGSVAVGVRDVAARSAAPTVLATGDSTMQGLESFLSDELGRDARVVSDVRPGLSLSGPNAWAPIAVAQTARARQDATVISIGANEGLPMRVGDGTTHECCDEAWTAEYARRMRKTMRTYRREGRARVYSLTIAAPRDPKRVPIVAAVNAAILRAAAGLKGVRVLRMDQLFSPEGYSETMRYLGDDVPVREPDGIHLNVRGLEIAALAVVEAIQGR